LPKEFVLLLSIFEINLIKSLKYKKMKNPFIVASALIIPILVATAQDTDKSKWKDVEIDFPKPMFVGTPVAAKLPNLDKSKKTQTSAQGTCWIRKFGPRHGSHFE
jgi:hypothetical protein